MALSIFLLILLPVLYLLSKQSRRPSKLPPGSMGFPIIGQSLSFLHAMRSNTAEQWLQRRISLYGPVSKFSLFGSPAVFITGQAANKFIFTSDSLAMQQPSPFPRIMGRRTLIELIGNDHRRVRAAVGTFLRPDALKRYVEKIDKEVRLHLEEHWVGRDDVTVLPLMKMLTFNVICSIMFGLEQGAIKDELVLDFTEMVAGLWSLPINFPFTYFKKGLAASKRAKQKLLKIMMERKKALQEEGLSSSHGDLISYLISLGIGSDEGDSKRLTEEEILDNAMLVMIAGHDTTSTLLTFIIRNLAKYPDIYERLVREHEDIANSKAPGEALTWNDLIKMKLSWGVALETLRMIPPIFGSFRKVLKDIEIDGYTIPKGWRLFWASNITQMDDNIFKEPQEFDPARFDNISSIPPYSFVAFGGGQRICPGYDFAKIETLVVLHHIVTRFRWKLGCKNDTFVRIPLPTPYECLPIKLEQKQNETFL